MLNLLWLKHYALSSEFDVYNTFVFRMCFGINFLVEIIG